MMRTVLLAVFASLCASSGASGQPAADCRPNQLNIPEAPYPCTYPDNRVTFRVVAPDAQKVRVRLGPGFDMTKGPDGLWYVTTTPQVVGFHYYTLSIDGAVVADPATRTFFGSGFYNSAIEVPEPDGDYRLKDVPRGQVRQHWYSSKVTGTWRLNYVYTPPDYDTNIDRFAYIGGFSGSSGGRGGFDPKTSDGGVFAGAAAFNRQVRVLFLGIGSSEGSGTKTFSDQLTQAGIKNIYYESPGTAHEWLTWRRCFKEFAPRLFR